MSERVVVCAANKYGDLVICGARHYDDVMCNQIIALNLAGKPARQGFIDQFGVFMDRKEALEVARAAGQIKRRCGGDEHALYSENLY